MTKQIPPNPPGNFFVGNMKQFQQDTLGFLVDSAQRYGDIYLFRLGPKKCYVVNRADYVHEVLVKKMKSIHKLQFSQKLLARFLGASVLTTDGAEHQRHRKMLQPIFHSQRINDFATVMTAYTHQMLENWQVGHDYDIKAEMSQLTMRIVGKTLFDVDVDHGINTVGEAAIVLQNHTIADYQRGFMLPLWLPIPHNRRLKRAMQQLDDVILNIIRERREPFEDRGDLLSMMLLAQSEDDGRTMTEQELRNETATLFVAGHETTSNALTWTWYLLAQNPEVEAQLQRELVEVLDGRLPTFADLPHLLYTKMVIKESLRLMPPVWGLTTRTPIEPVTIGGYQIDPGEWILVAPYVVHRHPDYFPEPEKFDPNRFHPEREGNIPRYAYFPFGGGPRICIGNAFALMEAQLILAAVAQRYKLVLNPGEKVVPVAEITLHSRDGLRMTITEQHSKVGEV